VIDMAVKKVKSRLVNTVHTLYIDFDDGKKRILMGMSFRLFTG